MDIMDPEDPKFFGDLYKFMDKIDADKFPLLKRLDVQYMNRCLLYNNIHFHRVIANVPLTHLKLNMNNFIDESNLFMTMLAVGNFQVETIQELNFIGMNFKPFQLLGFITIISHSKHLKTLKFEMNLMKEYLDLPDAIKENESLGIGKKWTDLRFENVTKDDQELIDNILANHPGILSLTINQEWLHPKKLILDHTDLKEVQFKFPNDNAHRSYKDLSQAYSLESYYQDSNYEINHFHEILQKFPKIKVLKLPIGYVAIHSNHIESIFAAAEGIEELHYDFVYAEYLGNAIAILDDIKKSGKNLKRLFIKAPIGDASSLAREKIQIFNDTKIQVNLIEVDDEPKRKPEMKFGDNEEILAPICVWKK